MKLSVYGSLLPVVMFAFAPPAVAETTSPEFNVQTVLKSAAKGAAESEEALREEEEPVRCGDQTGYFVDDVLKFFQQRNPKLVSTESVKDFIDTIMKHLPCVPEKKGKIKRAFERESRRYKKNPAAQKLFEQAIKDLSGAVNLLESLKEPTFESVAEYFYFEDEGRSCGVEKDDVWEYQLFNTGYDERGNVFGTGVTTFVNGWNDYCAGRMRFACVTTFNLKDGKLHADYTSCAKDE